MLKTVEDIELSNKKVLVRCDFNVPIKDGDILDDTKIVESLETIKYLIDKECKIILLSHLGKVKSEEDKASNSLKIVANRLGELLNKKVLFPGVTRSDDLKEKITDMAFGDVMLLENTRYEDVPDKLESSCDDDLAKYWASLGDIFVNDAFGSVHRCHASNYGISKYIESAVGFLVAKELKHLNELDNPERPFTVIMGGAKVEDKILLIENIIKRCDYLLLSGGLANTFLRALNFNIGLSLYDKESLERVKKIMLLYKDKIMLPLDATVGNKYDSNYADMKLINEIDDSDVISDIGPNTITKYKKVIEESKTIFINGTMGIYEDQKYQYGTRELYSILAKSKAKVFAGGGDSLSAINKFGFSDKFYYLSTGGGATLEYLINPKLECLSRILENNNEKSSS